MGKKGTLCVVPNNIVIITSRCLLGLNYAINTILLNRTCRNIQTLPQVMKKPAHFQYWPLIQKLHVVKDL